MSTDPLACLGYDFKDLIKPPLKIYSERKLESTNMPLKRTCSLSPLTNDLVQKFVKNMNLENSSRDTQHRKLDRSVSEPIDQRNNLQKVTNSSRYKTELCRPFDENGSCKYGDKCQFAHGYAELRSLLRHPKYKTELCRTYHSHGLCPYGHRCHFIHEDTKLLEMNAAQQNNNNRPKALSIGLGSSGELSPTTSTGSPTSSLTGFFADENSRSPQSPTGFIQQQLSHQRDYRNGSPTGYLTNQALLDPTQYDLFELNTNLLNSNLLILDVGGFQESAAPRMVNPNVARYDNMLFEEATPKERVPLFSRRGSP